MLNSEIITEARGIFQQVDPNNSQVSDTLMLTWIDACTLQLFSILNTLPKESVTGVVAADTITLPSKLLKLDYASILGPDGKHARLTTTDFCNFVRLNPGWEDQDSNKPAQLVRLSDTNWMMFPKPDANYIGKAVTLFGTVNPVVAATPISSPQIGLAMHCAYPHYLAWKAWLILNDPIRAQSEFGIYESLRKQNLGTVTNTTGSQQRFIMPA